LESVHNSCPYLKTLSLQNVLLAFLGDESLPETIVPASSLICFKLDSVSIICDANCVLPGYILRKYPNLQTLELLPATDSGDLAGMLREFHILGEEGKNASFYLKKRITTFYIYSAFPYSVNLSHSRFFSIEEPIDNPVTFPYTQGHNATWVRYRNDGLQFIDRLPRSITTLKLYEEMFVDIVFGIQAAGLQLSTLELYSDIRRSAGTNVFEQDEDMLFLESQTSLKTLQFATYSLIQYLNPPIVSSSVTQLQLYLPFTSHCSPICIAWVLSAFPAIEKLDIVSEDALCRADMSAYKPNYNLIELNLNRTLTSPTILNMIGSLAPNIRHLAYSLNEVGSDKTMLDSKRHLYNYPITTNEDDGTAYYHVDVTNFDLDTFRLTCNLGKDIVTGEIDIYYEIVNENQVKRFIVSSGHKPLTVVRDKNSPHLTMMTKVRVSCKKIIKLIIDNKTLVTFKDNAISLDL
jgi:hypothetical protein